MATVINTDEKIVCHCLQVTESDIQGSIEAGEVESVRCIMAHTKAGTGCTACHRSIKNLLAQNHAGSSPT